MKKNIPRKITLIEQIKQKIKLQIVTGKLFPGDRIESIRGITHKYDVSHITAVSALRELTKEGWIYAKVGSGSFVCDTPPVSSFKHMEPLPDTPTFMSPKGNLYFVYNKYPSDQNSYHGEVLCYIQDMIDKKGWQLKMCLAHNKQSVTDALNDPMNIGIIYNNNCDGLFSGNDNGPICIGYGMFPFNSNSSGVFPDNLFGGYKAGCYIFEKGHQRIRYITAEIQNRKHFNHYHFTQRYNGLLQACCKYDIELPPPIPWHIKNKETQKATIDILQQIKDKAPDAPTALVVGNKSMASEIYLIANGMGLSIPDDLSMISFIERSGTEAFPITNFDISGQALAIEIINLLERYHANNIPFAPSVLLPMTINEMNSVKTL